MSCVVSIISCEEAKKGTRSLAKDIYVKASMDRWGDGDGLDRGPKAPLTGVSKMGMSAFIKSSGDGAAACIVQACDAVGSENSCGHSPCLSQ